MKLLTTPIRLALIMMAALTLVSCGTSGPASVSGLRNVVGTDLKGARGLTPTDQRKIDRTVVGICSALIWTRAECAEHGRQSRESER